MRKPLVAAGHADQVQHLIDALCASSGIQMRQAKRYIASNVQVRKQRVILKHHANLA